MATLMGFYEIRWQLCFKQSKSLEVFKLLLFMKM